MFPENMLRIKEINKKYGAKRKTCIFIKMIKTFSVASGSGRVGDVIFPRKMSNQTVAKTAYLP